MVKKSSPSMAAMYAFYPLVVITGFIQLLVPSTIHMIMNHFHIKEGEAGVLPLIFFSGTMISAFVITHLIKKFSVKQLMISGAIIVSASLITASQSHLFILLAILFFFTGFGNGIMVTLPGIYATNLYSEKSAQLQSVIFSFLALGFVIGPIFPGIVLSFQISWKWCFAFPGLLILLVLIPIMFAKHEPIDKAEKLTSRIIKEIVSFDRKFFFAIVIALVLSSGSSIAFLTWLITFLEDKRGTSPGTSHVILATMGIAAVIGRLIWAKVAPKITVFRTLSLLVPISAIFVFFAPIPHSAIFNIILFFLAMIFISGINPLFLSAAAIYPKSHSSSAYTILFVSISIGGIIIPFVIGQVFQHAGSIIGMSSISLLFVIVIALLTIIKKELPISEHIHRSPMP